MKRLLVVVAAILLIGQARSPVLQLRDYIDALEAIRASDPTDARTKAEQLLNVEVESTAGRFTADSALLHEIMASPQTAKPHLDATIAALRDSGGATNIAPADPRLIKQLRQQEAPPELKAGGEIDTAPAGDEKTLEKTANGFSRAWKWIERQIDKIAEWFDRWWPKSKLPKDKDKVHGSARGLVVVIVAVILVVIAVLAFEVVRRSRGAMPPPIEESGPVASRRDEDPMSRGSNEWERYATQLAATGRVREAIRAWYHAVLVTLYTAGILHFRKGRTNWEYVAALSPELAWRSQFVTLTRRFEEEWYGHDRSSADALDDFSDAARAILDTVRRRAAA